ncbi:L-lactate permease [Marisediminicola antarctica]|uniref:L-lactate permease n=1 Tax=Marisediminicola antarctica TaxID=674079 RepID=A0A7L5AQS9_9MICO|nr:L-lactate permease [Marisediminicola antarctica]QHO70729.1 lactate transporter [Marisediminicola antarctica]
MFEQVLDPILGSLAVSATVAALPLAALFILLGVFKMKAAYAALVSLAVAMALAVFGWRMPVTQLLSATAEGAFYGLFPILWILVNALWIYKLTVVTGWFEVLGRTIRAISPDLRILSILVAFCFGALLESLAGFGAPVAISAAMLLAAGMKPIRAAVVSLLANTAPVAFGAMAAPIITLSGVTGLPIEDLAAMAGRQTPFVAILIPLVLVFVVDGKRGVRQTWPVALVAGFVFGLAQFVTSNYFAVELTDVVAAVATVAAVLVMLRFWQPKEIVGLGVDGDVVVQTRAEAAAAESIRSGIAPRSTETIGGGVALATATEASSIPVAQRTGPQSVWMALAPYLAIMAIFSVAQIPAVKTWLAEVGSVVFQWPGLDVVDASGAPAPAMTFKLDHLKATGTLLFFSGIVTMALYRVGLRDAVRAYRDTIVQLKWTILTVTVVLALSFVMNLSGQTASLGFGLAATGGLFVLLSPVIGWFGVALTGSDTSSNSLFGLLQVTAARQVGLDPVLMAAANSSAGVLGKMLSVQNLAVAAAAVGMVGSEGELFRKLIGWSLGLLAFLTIIIVLQAGPVLGWMVP